jgi:carboxymethylenebutenolidase
MESNTITLEDRLPVYEATPDGPVRGGAVVIQEAFGVNHHIEDVTRRLAAEGWHALAPHLFHRTGDPVIAYDDISTAMEHIRALTGEGLLADIDACLARLDAAGFSAGRVAITGFCMGGTVTFLAAAKRALGAAVTFYGGGVSESRWEGLPSMLELAPELQTPWLGLFGDRDQGIPVTDVERLREATAGAAVPAEIVRYADAGHGFHCDARPASYHEASASDAWARTLSWFDRYVEQAG